MVGERLLRKHQYRGIVIAQTPSILVCIPSSVGITLGFKIGDTGLKLCLGNLHCPNLQNDAVWRSLGGRLRGG